jgi:hypothetical protein
MKAILQPSLRGLSGSMGDWVYQYRNGKTFIGEKPVNDNEQTPAQLAHLERFGDALRFAEEAMADPALREFYETLAEGRDMSARNMAVSDFFNVPAFKPLDLSNYQGRVGDLIVIRVMNENGLASLDVAIDRQDGTDIEKGKAIELGTRSGKWIYTATQPVAKGSDIFIEVVGVDYTGKKIKMTENPVVGAEE